MSRISLSIALLLSVLFSALSIQSTALASPEGCDTVERFYPELKDGMINEVQEIAIICADGSMFKGWYILNSYPAEDISAQAGVVGVFDPGVGTAAADCPYPIAGQVYPSNKGPLYNARWECDGRLWQYQLPPDRDWHAVAITIHPGSYIFNGVACRFHLDAARNGAGSANPITAARGNGLGFSVATADGGQAYGLIECDGGASSGFEIKWV